MTPSGTAETAENAAGAGATPCSSAISAVSRRIPKLKRRGGLRLAVPRSCCNSARLASRTLGSPSPHWSVRGSGTQATYPYVFRKAAASRTKGIGIRMRSGNRIPRRAMPCLRPAIPSPGHESCTNSKSTSENDLIRRRSAVRLRRFLADIFLCLIRRLMVSLRSFRWVILCAWRRNTPGRDCPEGWQSKRRGRKTSAAARKVWPGETAAVSRVISWRVRHCWKNSSPMAAALRACGRRKTSQSAAFRPNQQPRSHEILPPD